MSIEKDTIFKIKENIEKSGYPLEIEVYKILREFDWNITPQYYYKDRFTEKEKSIDFICRKSIILNNKYFYSIFIYLVIECKKLDDKYWVLFTVEDDETYEHSLCIENLQTSYMSDENSYLSERDLKLVDLFTITHISKKIPHAISHYIPFNKQDSLYTAINQSLGALMYRKESVDATLIEYSGSNINVLNNLHIYYPIIICDENLLEYRVRDDNIDEKQHILYLTKGIGDQYSSYAIDVITLNVFKEYLKYLEYEFKALEKTFTK